MLVDGNWMPEADEADHETDGFHGVIGEDDGFEPEAGRYHLYISRACPWAHRAALVRRLRGLTDAISLDIVDPVRHDDGWEFSPGKDGCTPDRVNGSQFLRQVYTRADPSYTGRVTVPVLWDRKTGTIVNNESAEIARMLDTSFDEVGNDRTLYPDHLRDDIDDLLGPIFTDVNAGVYRAGFTTDQDEYESAVEQLFDRLDMLDARLADRRFLMGEKMTLADIFLFVTLFRFDAVYHTHFKCNIRKVTEFDSLWDYVRDIYQVADIAETCRLDHVKDHYYRSHTHINPAGIVPAGPDLDFTAAPDRPATGGQPFHTR